MRQLALHPALVPANYLEQLRQSMDDTNHAQPTTLTPEDRVRLQRILAQRVEDSEECPICFNALAEDPMITSCAHCYCLAWLVVLAPDAIRVNTACSIMEVLARDPRCPMVLVSYAYLVFNPDPLHRIVARFAKRILLRCLHPRSSRKLPFGRSKTKMASTARVTRSTNSSTSSD
jgi:hypothetical protein